MRCGLRTQTLRRYGFLTPSDLAPKHAAGFNRRMRKTARPVVWEGDGAQSPSLDLIQGHHGSTRDIFCTKSTS